MLDHLIAQSPLAETALRLAINTLAMTALVFGLYHRRYRNKDRVTVVSMVNVTVFAVLTILAATEVSLTAGFGFFTILALFILGSEQISKVEITYFFGSIAIAVVSSFLGPSLDFVAAVAIGVVVFVWALDHPRILAQSDGIKILLDRIDRDARSNPDRVKADLSARLGVEVMSLQITALNDLNDMAAITVFYRMPGQNAPIPPVSAQAAPDRAR